MIMDNLSSYTKCFLNSSILSEVISCNSGSNIKSFLNAHPLTLPQVGTISFGKNSEPQNTKPEKKGCLLEFDSIVI
ncbi:hypothetical protein ES703_76327 [subsurface metagenome]